MTLIRSFKGVVIGETGVEGIELTYETIASAMNEV